MRSAEVTAEGRRLAGGVWSQIYDLAVFVFSCVCFLLADSTGDVSGSRAAVARHGREVGALETADSTRGARAVCDTLLSPQLNRIVCVTSFRRTPPTTADRDGPDSISRFGNRR